MNIFEDAVEELKEVNKDESDVMSTDESEDQVKK